jgi:peptidoglycan/LPS O-acetylase OafA/YrhL
MVQVSSKLSNFLNFLRWTAAFLVVIGHIRGLVFVPYSDIIVNDIGIKFFYFITGIAHESVIVFFVLSGYLVGGKLLNDYLYGKLDWRNYFIKRISRLYIVLIPALIFGGLIDFIGVHWFNSLHIYNNAFHFVSLNYNVIERLSFEHFWSNFFMMQKTLTSTFGSNGPLWSLAYEFWYYLLLPILIMIFLKAKAIMQAAEDHYANMVLFILLFIVLILFLDKWLIFYFLLWMIGVGAFFINKFRPPFWAAITFTIAVLLLGRFGSMFPAFFADFLLAIGISLMLLAYENTKLTLTFVRTNSLLADFSYSVYLFHFPLFILLLSILIENTGIGYNMQPSFETFLLFLLMIVSIYIYSFTMYLLFERNTHKVRTYLMKRFA